MKKLISQREARALRKRVAVLERRWTQRNSWWSREYPGGVHIAEFQYAPAAAAVKIARRLGHAVVVKESGDNLNFYAMSLEELK